MLAESKVQKLENPHHYQVRCPARKKPELPSGDPTDFRDLRVWPRVRPGHEQNGSNRAF